MAGVRQFDESEVLDLALGVFWQRGFAATTMQDLAQATGVQRGSLYNAYRDKETLFLRAFEVYRDGLLVKLRKTLDKPRLRDALRGFVDFLVASMTTPMQDDGPTRGCLSTKTAVGLEDLDPLMRTSVRSMLDEYESMLEARLARPEPGVRLRLPAREAARQILTTTRGLAVIERVYQDPQRLRRTAHALVDMLLEMDRA